MTEEKKRKKPLQWHPAFYAGIQIELKEEADYLTFENEHQLGTKPMEIDVLIIKKNGEISIRKNIGRIFRKYNIIEYKSPEDYLSIDDFYKVYGYCYFYKADSAGIDAVKIEELTISFVCNKYPREMIRHLQRERGLVIENIEKGIYHIKGDIIPMQIIVSSRLTKKENLWLKSLTDHLKTKDIMGELLEEYKENYKNPLYESVMDIIIQANESNFKEVKNMCRALEELMRDRIEELEGLGEARGEKRGEERGKNRVNKLILKLSQLNRMEDIIKAAGDGEYQMQLFEEFSL